MACFKFCTSTEEVYLKVDLVKEHIFEMIKKGDLKSGSRLPSCRKLSETLSINKITVNKAYKSLENEHVVYSINRGGYYLTDHHKQKIHADEVFDFFHVKFHKKYMPYREFIHSINKASESHIDVMYDYQDPMGVFELRQEIAKKMMDQNIYAKEKHIVMTNGSQQGLYLTLKILFKDENRKLLVESPTYSLVHEIASDMNIEIIEIPRTQDGIDIKQLKYILEIEKIKGFYIMPRHHNPTGFNMSENNKKAMMKQLEKHDVYVIEDDYLSDIGSEKNFAPLYYYKEKDQVIYLKSYSKSFMPGLRVGAVILPHELVEGFTQAKKISDLGTSSFLQKSLAVYLTSGMYDKHIKKVKAACKKKMMIASEIVKGYNHPNLTVFVQSYGIFIWIELCIPVPHERVKKELKALGVIIDFFDERHIRLCTASLDENGIKKLDTILYVLTEALS